MTSDHTRLPCDDQAAGRSVESGLDRIAQGISMPATTDK
jgi:hypothetical protein